jgi:alpha-L-rhamnosidase
MKYTLCITALLFGGLVSLCHAAPQSDLRPVYPQCERLETAILKPGQSPTFSWGLDAGGRDGAAQSAYEIRVATPDGKAVWESGKVKSGDTLDVPYTGPTLPPGSQYDWQVRVHDEKGDVSDWTQPQRFFTGLTDWKAQWITSPEIAAIAKETKKLYEEERPARMLRTEWTIAKPVKTATLFITSLGSYQSWINGKLVSDDRIAPSVTQFGYRVFYRAYDVSDLLRQGPNALAVLLGDGAFIRGRLSAFGSDFVTRLLAQLEIEYADGSRESVGTGPDWRSMQEKSPWRVADYDLGGIYDARLFDPAWTSPDYADGGWNKAAVLPAPKGTRIDPEMAQPCRVSEVLAPVAEFEPKPGVRVFDFGRQFTGVCRFTVTLPAGHEIRLRHAQALRKDKSLDVSNLKGNAKNETVYISAGGKSECFEGLPFHFNGCRYVEISGLPSREALEQLDAIHFGDAMRPVSTLQSSDSRLNRLWEMMRHTYHSNFKSGILTDCVGRNERGAWLGDGYTSHIKTVGYFFDSIAHHRKRMQDLRDQVAIRSGSTPPGQVGCRAPGFGAASSPFWSDAATIVPRDAHVFYDDLHTVEWQYGDGGGQSKALVDFYQTENGPSGKWTRLEQSFKIWGPWLDRAIHLPPGSDRTRWNSLDYPSTWFNRAKKVHSTSKEAFGTFWWAASARAVADMARCLAKEDEAKEYDAMAKRSNDALIRDFDNGDGTWDLNDQPIYTYGLISGAAGGDLKQVFVKNLLQTVKAYGGHLSGGTDVFYQTLIALSHNGYPDLAWFMAMRQEMPSFGYMIDAGATAFWERFDLHHPEWGMNRITTTLDFNHVGLLPVGEWIVEDIVGLRPDPAQPGFKHFFIKPWTGSEPKQIDFRFDSPRGPIRVAWKRDGDKLTLDATVPPNCTATVQWPDGREENLTSGTHTLTGNVPLKMGQGVEGGLDEIRRYFKENPYDPAKDTNRYFERKGK